MKIFAPLFALLFIVPMTQGFGQGDASTENVKAGQEPRKAKHSPLKTSSQFQVKLRFPNDSVESVLNIYDRLIEKEVRRDSSLSEGPDIALVTPVAVSRGSAISLIEAALLVNGYVVEELKEGEVVVRFDASRQGEWIIDTAKGSSEPVTQKPQPGKRKDGPSHEEIQTYKDLSEEQKREFRDFIAKSMKEFPDMSRKERGNLIRNYITSLANSDGQSDSKEKKDSSPTAK